MDQNPSDNLKPEWRDLSDILESARARGVASLSTEDLSRIGPLYRLAVSDLALARARNDDPESITFLNDLVARGHGLIYTSPPSRLRNALRFIVSGFPSLVRKELPAIGIATAIFLLGAVLAFVIVWRDPLTAGIFLPERYTEAMGRRFGSENTEPAPLPEAVKPVLSSAIMANNINVSIMAFAAGITFGLATVYVLLQNGMMLGALAAIYTRHNLSLSFWSLILPHGVIELAAIFISGGAGLILGGALIKPGNMSRWAALAIAARRAVPLMGGVALMLVLAGAIEGFLTPAPIKAVFKLAFAGLTVALLALYFFARRGVTK
ncbi:MAG: stage II sporulation protein M [Armatimonadota bacterium]|nr:stage II sporulation protein M [Armatimonadota bacterium]